MSAVLVCGFRQWLIFLYSRHYQLLLLNFTWQAFMVNCPIKVFFCHIKETENGKLFKVLRHDLKDDSSFRAFGNATLQNLWHCRQSKIGSAYHETNHCVCLSRWCVQPVRSGVCGQCWVQLAPARQRSCCCCCGEFGSWPPWGCAAMLAPCLLFCQQHLLGPITGLDQPPIGLRELAWISQQRLSFHICERVCMCVESQSLLSCQRTYARAK